jgi:hypothetical protein
MLHGNCLTGQQTPLPRRDGVIDVYAAQLMLDSVGQGWGRVALFPDALEEERRHGVGLTLRWVLEGEPFGPLIDGPVSARRAVDEARLPDTSSGTTSHQAAAPVCRTSRAPRARCSG